MLFRKKKVLTHEENVLVAEKAFEDAVQIFDRARRNVESANVTLDKVIAAAQEDLARSNAIITNSLNKKSRNDKFQAKFADLSIAE
jgi:hypothetical protein